MPAIPTPIDTPVIAESLADELSDHRARMNQLNENAIIADEDMAPETVEQLATDQANELRLFRQMALAGTTTDATALADRIALRNKLLIDFAIEGP